MERLQNIHRDVLFGKYQKIFQIGMSPVAFWKLFHKTGVMKQDNKVQGWKKLKHYFMIAFLFNAAWEKVDDQVLIWLRKTLSLPRKLKLVLKPVSLHYFMDQWPWMTSNYMPMVFAYLSEKPLLEKEEASFLTM